MSESNVEDKIFVEEKTDAGQDPELEELLTSALKDFAAPPVDSQLSPDFLKHAKAEQSPETPPQSPAEAAGASKENALFSDVFDEEMSHQFQKQFAEVMRCMEQNPDLSEQFGKLSMAATANTCTSADTAGGAFSSVLNETLESLTKNAQELENGSNADRDMLNAFSMLTSGMSQPEFQPMMQGIMKNLLSKDILYPSLKDIVDKYPDWLKANEDKIEKRELERYKQQYELMRRVCGEFETEAAAESEQSQSDRFQRIMDLMQQMQECGQPPAELLGDQKDFELDENGIPAFLRQDQCSIM